MTKQELIQNIRRKNPQYSSLSDDILIGFAIKQKPELKNIIPDLGNIQEPTISKNPDIKKISEVPKTENKQPSNIDYATGFVKGLARTGLDIASISPQVHNVLEIGGLKEKIEEKLKPESEKEKIGGYVETAAEIAIPSGLAIKATKGIRNLSAAKKSLSLGLDDLSRISEGKFKKIFGIEKKELENIGGVIRTQTKKMPEKIDKLSKEFAEILQDTPSKNLKNAQNLGAEFRKKTLDLFEGENKILNEKTIRAYLKKSIEENMSFDTPFQKKEILNKTIEPFMKQIKQGSLKGLEEARGKLSVISRDKTGKLKPAIDELNKAVKKVIKSNLPEAKKIAYDEYSKKMAKLFDIRDILKAKNVASGTSAAKKVVSVLKKGLIVAGGYAGIKSLLK